MKRIDKKIIHENKNCKKMTQCCIFASGGDISFFLTFGDKKKKQHDMISNCAKTASQAECMCSLPTPLEGGCAEK